MMARLALLALLPVLFVGACVSMLPPVEVKIDPDAPDVSFVEDVSPILNRRCVVCHSCYNAACQLKLGSYEGVARGGSKKAVYDSTRLKPMRPTRLFIDAQSTAGWRDKGFHSVTLNDASGDLNDSIMLHLLEAKRRHPGLAGTFEAEAIDLTCPANPKEVSSFLTKHPDRGMPFGFPGLSPGEHATVAVWLQQGALGPTTGEQAAIENPGPRAAAEIAKWEELLNYDDPKYQMTARYLYEHFFLADLSFSEAEPGDFYRIQRSTTPSGEPVDVIPTVRPYDETGVDPFYYRFVRMRSPVVHKTHMVVELNDTKLARLRKLFIETEWLETPHLVKPDDTTAANPFVIYAQIPPVVRYQFLLDNAEYILRTFIRGPVCKGQVALNVIHDHFWVMFLDPKADQTVRHPGFLLEQASNLRLPTEAGSDDALLKTFSNRYRERYKKFYRAKSDLYDKLQPAGPALEDIWTGERAQDAPILTIYRHFDSASVHKGLLGGLPRTAWLIDYSQFERIYYALVAGFDVFGNLSHQVNVRRYMDYLRIEGELNFLSFMPDEVRLPMLQSWYIGARAIENVDRDESRPMRGTQVPFRTDKPKRELIEMLVADRFLPATGIAFDRVNYRRDGEEVPMPESFSTHQDILNGFRALTAPGTGFIRHITDSGLNVALVRVRDYEGEDRVFTIVVNRWHDNVNSMFLEAGTLNPAKDSIDFISGSIGSYPNYFLDLSADEVPDLFDMLENFDGSPEYVAKLEKYGVNRADADFWATFDWFQGRLDAADPLQAGLYDLNRYYREAVEDMRDRAP
jgi:hypothetical protein